ncbi:MAG: hypothetical protein IT393_06805 [Nitrospirae bacterium]|nr:hypothetical protein [Nitrospirota bacterium]
MGDCFASLVMTLTTSVRINVRRIVIARDACLLCAGLKLASTRSEL